MKHNTLFLILFSTIVFSCGIKKSLKYHNEDLKIEKLNNSVYIHTSYLNTTQFGKVACNGAILIQNKSAWIIDTPVDSSSSVYLIKWLQKKGIKIKGVYVTHFHVDCLGGLKEFHHENIPSIGYYKTVELAKIDSVVSPQNWVIGFENHLKFNEDISSDSIEIYYFGEGHTKDNTIVYYRTENVLFGGCLIKEIGADKGNLSDANTDEWPQTVKAIKKHFPSVKTIIPGHGNYGGAEILDYTITLFDK